MQVWTQEAHECFMNNFKLQCRNQVRVQDTSQIELFSFLLELLLHLVQHESKKDSPPPKKKEKKEGESRNL
jgi:hypothetical protein